MINEQQLDKQHLVEQVLSVVINKESAFFSILTDKKRSIMLRFSMGQLISTHCRSRNPADAIDAIVESDQLKFSQSPAQPKEALETMPAESFLQAINPGEEPLVFEATAHETKGTQEAALSADNATLTTIDAELQSALCDIARDYIGKVADLLIATTIARQLPLDETIEVIARSIPVTEHANAFRKRANALSITQDAPAKKPSNNSRPLEFL